MLFYISIIYHRYLKFFIHFYSMALFVYLLYSIQFCIYAKVWKSLPSINKWSIDTCEDTMYMRPQLHYASFLLSYPRRNTHCTELILVYFGYPNHRVLILILTTTYSHTYINNFKNGSHGNKKSENLKLEPEQQQSQGHRV